MKARENSLMGDTSDGTEINSSAICGTLVQKKNTKEAEYSQDDCGISSETFWLAAEKWIELYNKARALVEAKQAELRRTTAEYTASTGARSGEHLKMVKLA